MPHKDPIAAKASKRAYYLAHKEKWAESNAKSKAKLRAIAIAKKQEEANKPKQIVAIVCKACGIDITYNYISKHGPRCKTCVAVYNKEYRTKNAERIAESKRLWKIKNKEHVEAMDRAYASANPGKKAAARKKWTETNPAKDSAAKRLNALKRKQRVPAWLSEDDLWLVEQAYELAALRTKVFGFQWHVDHIIPLNGRKVSGLHVPANLQVIPWVDNLRKGNRMEAA